MKLEIKNIQAYYGNIQALKGISIELNAGEIVTLIGGNGAGKTTTLMSISGLVPLKEGEIYFNNKSIKKLSPEAIVSMGIVQVPEGRRIFSDFTVMENLKAGTYLRNDKNGIARDFERIFKLFPILKMRTNQLGGTLSGGEQQMLAISRALMAKPKVLLLDEPSLGLAPLMIQQIFRIIEKINKKSNVSILLVEQNANQALQIADRGYVMENGLIVTENKASNLLNDDVVKKSYLGIV